VDVEKVLLLLVAVVVAADDVDDEVRLFRTDWSDAEMLRLHDDDDDDDAAFCMLKFSHVVAWRKAVVEEDVNVAARSQQRINSRSRRLAVLLAIVVQ
jgi:hypothetical protein